MGRPGGQKFNEVDIDKAQDVPRRIWRMAVEQVRGELEAYVKAACSKPYPPASTAGNYPHLRTGELVEGIRVVYSEPDNALRMYSKTHDHHGVFLQEGLRDGTTRPFGTKALLARDWVARIAKVAKAMNK
jgi:hypothetical protein